MFSVRLLSVAFLRPGMCDSRFIRTRQEADLYPTDTGTHARRPRRGAQRENHFFFVFYSEKFRFPADFLFFFCCSLKRGNAAPVD